MVSCINCDHHCHCGNNGVCSVCKCSNCEHPNALDEFWKRLEDNAGAMINLTKHKD
jgi:hypothetical protein